MTPTAAAGGGLDSIRFGSTRKADIVVPLFTCQFSKNTFISRPSVGSRVGPGWSFLFPTDVASRSESGVPSVHQIGRGLHHRKRRAREKEKKKQASWKLC